MIRNDKKIKDEIFSILKLNHKKNNYFSDEYVSSNEEIEYCEWLMKNREENEENNDCISLNNWLNGEEIDLILSKLSISKEFKIISSNYFNNLKKAFNDGEKKPFSDLINQFNAKEKFIFIPVENLINENNHQIIHLSLLIYEMDKKMFYHFDSLNGFNYKYIELEIKELLKIQGVGEKDLSRHLINRYEFQQNDIYDCGINVICLVYLISKDQKILKGKLTIDDFQKNGDKLREKMKSNKLKEIFNSLSLKSKLKEKIKIADEEIYEEESNSKNILLLGETGCGKSSLSNLIIEKDGYFREGKGLSSETKELSYFDFKNKINKLNYRIIDTVGFNEIEGDNESIVVQLMEFYPFLNCNGINQLFLVVNSRFTETSFNIYKILKGIVFFTKENYIDDHIVMIRTNFSDFEDDEECEKDVEKFLENIIKTGNQELIDFVNYLKENKKIIHLDNPSIDVKKEALRKINIATREESRKKILNYLSKNSEVFFPDKSHLERIVDEFSVKSDELISNFFSIFKSFSDYQNELEIFLENKGKIICQIKESWGLLKNDMENRFYHETTSNSIMLTGKAVTVSGFFFPPLFIPGIVTTYAGLATTAVIDSTYVYKEWKIHDDFLKKVDEIKKNHKFLKELEDNVRREMKNFSFNYIELKSSIYCKLRINDKNIDYLERINNFLIKKEIIDCFAPDQKETEISHSTNMKVVRTGLESTIKIFPTPYTIYAIFRDRKEINHRDSLNDFDNLVKEYEANLTLLFSKNIQSYRILKELEIFGEEMGIFEAENERKMREEKSLNIIEWARINKFVDESEFDNNPLLSNYSLKKYEVFDKDQFEITTQGF